ncbi:MAG: tail fiber domain-containing protein [Vicinamibacterales bacterium]
MTRHRSVLAGVFWLFASLATETTAQPIGTFRWQVRPFCNVVTVAVTQNGAIYRLEGTDDQCGGGADAASVTGTAFPNPDGTIGFGFTVVTTPGGRPLHVDAEITTATFSGTWRDSAGATGTFVLTPGAGNGGSPRPLPSSVPATIALRPDGGFLAGGAQGVGAIPASGPGNRMMWYPSKAAFRAGEAVAEGWDDSNIGYGSVALGNGPNAIGFSSTAMGQDSNAIGTASTALGNATRATGPFSTAMGDDTIAAGNSSTAMGNSTSAEGTNSLATGSRTRAVGRTSTAMGSSSIAEGPNSLAAGSSTLASGSASTALGSSTESSGSGALAGGSSSVASGGNALAFGFAARAIGSGSVALGSRSVADTGSFVFADGSSNNPVGSGVHQFFVRASGGAAFFSNAASTTGVLLAANGTQWASLSDVRAKHRFRELDGDDVLSRIAALPVTEWSYRAQDDAIRHIGPTAQDFHAAFGLGEDPLRIGTLDADGVALAAVKALEARTRTQAERIDALERRLAEALAALCDATRTCR